MFSISTDLLQTYRSCIVTLFPPMPLSCQWLVWCGQGLLQPQMGCGMSGSSLKINRFSNQCSKSLTMWKETPQNASVFFFCDS